MEPFNNHERVHSQSYSSLLEGKLLSGIPGHNICRDYFGLPTQAETKQGLSQNGEASMVRWRESESRADRQEISLTLSTHLPTAGISFSRNLRIRRGSPVVYFTETVSNRNRKNHFPHWVQQVTLGPPWKKRTGTRGLEFGTTALPVTRDENTGMGTLYGVSAYDSAPAGGRKTVRYMATLAQIPRELKEISRIEIARNEIAVRGEDKGAVGRVSALGLSNFGLTA